MSTRRVIEARNAHIKAAIPYYPGQVFLAEIIRRCGVETVTRCFDADNASTRWSCYLSKMVRQRLLIRRSHGWYSRVRNVQDIRDAEAERLAHVPLTMAQELHIANQALREQMGMGIAG